MSFYLRGIELLNDYKTSLEWVSMLQIWTIITDKLFQQDCIGFSDLLVKGCIMNYDAIENKRSVQKSISQYSPPKGLFGYFNHEFI